MQIAPPMSYISVADFRSAKELANYLLFLNAHDDEYIKYFAWKYEWKVDWRSPICGLCEKLHSGDYSTSIVDLDQVAQQSGCKIGIDAPWMMQSLADEIEERTKEEEEILKKEQELTKLRMAT